MANIYLVRHGQSCWNLQNKFTGSVNIPLNANGRAQARALADTFAKLNLDIVYTSSLIRAQETALLALESYAKTCQFIDDQSKTIQGNLPIIVDSRLNERGYGELQGMNKDDAREKFGVEQVQLWRRAYADVPPAGESLAMTVARVNEFAEQILFEQLNSGLDIAIFAHGNSIRALHKIFLNVSESEIMQFEVATAELLHYQYIGGRFELQS